MNIKEMVDSLLMIISGQGEHLKVYGQNRNGVMSEVEHFVVAKDTRGRKVVIIYHE